MGTNYYYHESGERTCPHCNRPHEGRHVGKSSAGWCFSLRVYPEDGINSLDDWRALWAKGGAIFDEYDEPVTVAEMLSTITERAWDGRRDQSPEWYAVNHAVPGPNGLARHGGSPWGRAFDVRPGDGTYDLCNYEFS
jgi:hypothetical protein